MGCIEMYDGSTFCCGDAYADVDQRAWHFNDQETDRLNGTTEADCAAEIAKADCRECLRRLSLLGAAAQERLAALMHMGKMGRP